MFLRLLTPPPDKDRHRDEDENCNHQAQSDDHICNSLGMVETDENNLNIISFAEKKHAPAG